MTGDRPMNFLRHSALACLGLSFLAASAGAAIVPLDEQDMAAINGQDGVRVNLNLLALGADRIQLTSDPGRYVNDTTGVIGTTSGAGYSALSAGVEATGFSARAVDLTGGTVGGALTGFAELDVGSSAASASAAFLRFYMQLDRARYRVDRIGPTGDTARSMGTWALDAPISFALAGKGLFNQDGGSALRLAIGPEAYSGAQAGNFFYRQLWHQHPYLVLGDLDFLWSMPSGKVAIDNGGLLIEGDTDFRLLFNLIYKFPLGAGSYTGLNESTEFVRTSNDQMMLRYGWTGGLNGARVRIGPGGIWYGTTGSPAVYNTANKSEGLTLGLQWNYANSSQPSREFKWVVGEPADSQGKSITLEFGNWINLPGAAYGFNMPSITLDSINAGQGPGGLCWGGPDNGPASGACTGTGRQFVSVVPGNINRYDPSAPRTDAKAMAILIRDGSLPAYSNSVRVFDSNGFNQTYSWGLIYTLANIDANIFLYGGGNPSDTSAATSCAGGNSLRCGIIADIVLMTQTMSTDLSSAVHARNGQNWAKGSHFLISDTSANLGIGLVSSSFLLAADDLRLWIRPDWNQASTNPLRPYDSGLDLLSYDTRFQLKGMFGGVTLPSGANVVPITNIDFNYEGGLNLRLSPSGSAGTFLGFSGVMHSYQLSANSGGGTYLSLEEPSRPGVDVRLGSITGTMAIVNGRLDLRKSGDDGLGQPPKLELSSEMQFGETATDRLRNAVTGVSPDDSTLTGGALLVNNVSFGGTANKLGSIAIPAGQWGASITLKPQ